MFDNMKKVLFVSSLGWLMSLLFIMQSNVRAELLESTEHDPIMINIPSVAAPTKLTPTEIDNVQSQSIPSGAMVSGSEITEQETAVTTAVIPIPNMSPSEPTMTEPMPAPVALDESKTASHEEPVAVAETAPTPADHARIEQASDFLKIKDNRHACVIKTDHTLWCWGANQLGQLGDGTVADAVIPVQISGKWRLVELGDQHTCAIKQDTSLWCWGANQFGQLGDGTKVARSMPVNVGNSNDWVKVDANQRSTCALKANDALFCWGENDVKLESVADTNQPQPVIDNSHLNQNQPVECGTKADGTVWCFVG